MRLKISLSDAEHEAREKALVACSSDEERGLVDGEILYIAEMAWTGVPHPAVQSVDGVDICHGDRYLFTAFGEEP